MDPKFLGPDGRPRDLSFTSGSGCFTALVSLVLPRERPSVCRDILLATGAIIRLPNGRLRLRERAALAGGAASGVVLADEYLRPLRALLIALHTNLLRRARGAPTVAFQRAVSGFVISPEDMAELQGFVSRHGSALLETVDDWLSHRQKSGPNKSKSRGQKIRPYLGLYLSSEASGLQVIPSTAHSRAKPKSRLKPAVTSA